MKNFHIQSNIGKAKYVVNFHDGMKTHQDESPFFDVAIFKSKKKLSEFTSKLVSNGYAER